MATNVKPAFDVESEIRSHLEMVKFQSQETIKLNIKKICECYEQISGHELAIDILLDIIKQVDKQLKQSP